VAGFDGGFESGAGGGAAGERADLRHPGLADSTLTSVLYYAAGQVAGSAWDDVVRTRIFASLGMAESNTGAIDAQKSPDYAAPHDSNPDGRCHA
jgi:CubicO group peptidase (beta-lactamase class C family)